MTKVHDAHVHDGERSTTSPTRRERAEAGGEVCADLTGILPMAHNRSEYLMVAVRRETRFGFVKELLNKRSETIREAMVDMRLLLRGIWRFHSDEGREFMGVVDDWLTEHAVLHTTPGAYDPNAESFVKKVVVLEIVVFGVSCIKRTHLCVCGLTRRNTLTKSLTTANHRYLDKTTWWNRSCWSGVPLRDKLNMICCREKSLVHGHRWVVWRLQLEYLPTRRGSLGPIVLQGNFVGLTRRVPHGIKFAISRYNGEVEEVFPSTTVRTCDTLFLLFGGAGTKSQRLRQSSKSLAKV